ncbi:MAG: hypothetical protein M1832_001936 [Thelocarpon impressellum]|nr:MAG: hypothetical protein M1832_001936 [Thelocarpon impressellum]
MMLFSFLVQLVGLLAGLATLVSGAAIGPRWCPEEKLVTNGGPLYLFTFGDSYTSTDFRHDGPQPNASNPLGNPAQPTKNWVYHLATAFNSSLTFSFNYARGGATVSPNIVKGSNPSFQEQAVNWFVPTAGARPPTEPWTEANSIAGIFIGINDIGGSLGLNETAFHAQVDALHTVYFATVDKLYDTGMRNFFFLNVPPLQYSKFVTDRGAIIAQRWASFQQTYNTKLAAKVQAYQALHPDIGTYLFDNAAAWTQVFASPTTYGFRDNSTIGDYGDPNVIWGDGYHPSSAMHKAVSRQLASELHATFNY